MLWIILFAFPVLWLVASADWLSQVPPRDHEKINPYHDQPESVQAGHLLFLDHCAQCHGKNGEGRSKKPALRTPRIQAKASEGDLHWLLVNGNMRHGMPSWSKLPDPQLWQLVSYLKSQSNEK